MKESNKNNIGFSNDDFISNMILSKNQTFKSVPKKQ